MANPLGMIRDPNPNRNAADVWSIIINNIVVNTIIASYNDILAIYKNYDYCVDITMNGSRYYDQGNTYDPANDDFIIPPAPPVDYVQNLRGDFNDIIDGLLQGNIDANTVGNLTPLQINAAYNSALNDNPGLDQVTLNFLQTTLQFIINKG